MKIRISTIVMIASAGLYFLGTVAYWLFWGTKGGPISYFLDLVAMALLVLSGLFSNKRPLFLGGVAAFFFVTLVNTLLFNWNFNGYIIGVLTNFLPLNFLLATGGIANIFFDLQLITLIVGITFHFIPKEFSIPSFSGQPAAAGIPRNPNQAATFNRPVNRSYSNIDGDAVVQVQKLGDLLQQGLITEEEFQTKKKQILGL